MTRDEAELARLTEVRRAQRKIAAKHRAELAFKHALERIDNDIDVIQPAKKEIEAAASEGKTLEITDGS